LNRTIRRSFWIIPVMQTMHILGIGMVLSSVVMLDLRAWGVAQSHTPTESAQRFAPWIWYGMILLTLTGIVLTIAAPRRTLLDGVFQVKMLMMAVAIPLTFAFHAAVRRSGGWESAAARIALGAMAAATLLLWLAITFAGRGRWMANLVR
jgi:hypothetical protein